MLFRSTLLGVALLSAVSLGLLGEEELAGKRISEKIFTPSSDRVKYDDLYRNYLIAVKRAIISE